MGDERWTLGDGTAVYAQREDGPVYLFRLPTRELADMVLRDHARATSPAPEGGDLAADNWRRFSTSQVRGALGWWLYAAETGDHSGGSEDAARDAIGHADADRLARLLPLRPAPSVATPPQEAEIIGDWEIICDHLGVDPEATTEAVLVAIADLRASANTSAAPPAEGEAVQGVGMLHAAGDDLDAILAFVAAGRAVDPADANVIRRRARQARKRIEVAIRDQDAAVVVDPAAEVAASLVEALGEVDVHPSTLLELAAEAIRAVRAARS